MKLKDILQMGFATGHSPVGTLLKDVQQLGAKAKSLMLLLSVVLVIVAGCTGKEPTEIDTTIPKNPVMIPHLGDTGDLTLVAGEPLTEENNGIDAVPEGNWLRIQWRRIDDPKIDFMRIYRFGQYPPTVTLVDSLSRSQIQLNDYTDTRLHNFNPVGQEWSYFLQLFLTNGNYSYSDTVSYKLLQKPFLLAPENYARLSPDSLAFSWERTEDAIHYRVLVFDSDYEYIWHEDYYTIEDSDYTLLYSGPDLSAYIGDIIIWRVDSFGDIDNEEGISISGAESQERYIELISN